ncbi:MAG: type II secretion system F family protein [Methanobacteriota archaeon]|nr:MAG: type II secretion system F family protein [Euryarchaeota archaeon]
MAATDVFNDFFNRKKPAELVPEPTLNEMEREQREIVDKIQHHRKTSVGFGKFLRHPVEFLRERPINSLIISLPLAFLIFLVGFSFIVGFYGFEALFTSTMIDDVIILAILVAVIPLAILDFIEGHRVNSLEASLPNFFRDVAGMNDSGMTLPNAVHIVSEGEYGSLTPYIRRLDAEMSWSVPFVDALYRFGIRVKTPLAERSVDLIAKASKAGGDASEVLRAAATDAYEFYNLKMERKNNMLIYMVIVLISFFVFLFVVAILVSTFLTTMAEAGSAAAATGSAGSKFIGNVDLFLYKRLFAHAGMIQGFFSGLVAGQMGEGRAVAGLKYSAIMLIIAWIMFRFFV